MDELVAIKKELKNSKQYADFLAITLREAVHPGSPFAVCQDLHGVLTQIDNLVAVLLNRYDLLVCKKELKRAVSKDRI